MIYYTSLYEQTMQISSTAVWLSVIAIIAVALVFYALRSVGVYTLTKKAGIKHVWMSFVPLLWVFVAAQLVGQVRIFGVAIKKFHVWFFVVFAVCQTIFFLDDFLALMPLVGYYLQGGTISIAGKAFATIDYPYLSDVYTSTMVNVGYLKSDVFFKIRNIVIIMAEVLNLVEIVFTVFFYSGLFRKYFPQRYMLATLLSLFLGLFAPFVFAIRNNKAIDYQEYIRSKYRNVYGPNPYDSQNGSGQTYRKPEEPFGEYKENSNEQNSNPFSEFDDKDN